MKLIKDLKSFWKENRNGYLWSCLALTFLVLFMGCIRGFVKNNQMGILSLGILVSFPIMLLMAFGIYELTGGNKE
jgi:ABC-type polysaccharide/polyol phosphate export permease